MKYRKKPVVIDAWQYSGPATTATLEIKEIFKQTGCRATIKREGTQEPWVDRERIVIPTLEGEHILATGDYIIKGIKGEFYPCKPDIFEASYEAVLDDELGEENMTLKEKVIILEREVALLREILNMHALLANKQTIIIDRPLADPPSFRGYPWSPSISTGTPLPFYPVTTSNNDWIRDD